MPAPKLASLYLDHVALPRYLDEGDIKDVMMVRKMNAQTV